MATLIPTGNAAKLIGWIGRASVRHAKGGDHWPGYDDTMTLRGGYWVGDDRRHVWIGRSIADIRDEAAARLNDFTRA